jgi:hypothetical protein
MSDKGLLVVEDEDYLFSLWSIDNETQKKTFLHKLFTLTAVEEYCNKNSIEMKNVKIHFYEKGQSIKKPIGYIWKNEKYEWDWGHISGQ